MYIFVYTFFRCPVQRNPEILMYIFIFVHNLFRCPAQRNPSAMLSLQTAARDRLRRAAQARLQLQ